MEELIPAVAVSQISSKIPVYDISSVKKYEKAYKWSLSIDEKFNPIWTRDIALVQIEKVPCSKGLLRTCFKMTDEVRPGVVYIAKFGAANRISRNMYFNTAIVQAVSQKCAELYNKVASTPLKFHPTFVLELVERNHLNNVCVVEPLIEGDFKKENASTSPDDDEFKNTQAFGHYTIHKSNNEVLVSGLQRINNIYVNSDIHTKSGKGFFDKNSGLPALQKFAETHVCNSYCKSLQLEPLNVAKVTELAPASPAQERKNPGYISNKFVAAAAENRSEKAGFVQKSQYLQSITSPSTTVEGVPDDAAAVKRPELPKVPPGKVAGPRTFYFPPKSEQKPPVTSTSPPAASSPDGANNNVTSAPPQSPTLTPANTAPPPSPTNVRYTSTAPSAPKPTLGWKASSQPVVKVDSNAIPTSSSPAVPSSPTASPASLSPAPSPTPSPAPSPKIVTSQPLPPQQQPTQSTTQSTTQQQPQQPPLPTSPKTAATPMPEREKPEVLRQEPPENQPDYGAYEDEYRQMMDDVQIISATEITFIPDFDDDDDGEIEEEGDEEEYYDDDDYDEEVKPLPPLPAKSPNKAILKKTPIPNKTRRVRWLDLAEFEKNLTVAVKQDIAPIQQVKFSAAMAASAPKEKGINYQSFKVLAEAKGSQVECICGDDTNLYTGSNEGHISVWDNSLKVTSSFRAHNKAVKSIVLHNSTIFTGSADASIHSWDVNTKKAITKASSKSDIHALCVSEAHSILFSAENDKTVKVWDTHTLQHVKTLTGHTRAVKALFVFGNYLYSGSNDQQVFIWNLNTHRIVKSLTGHEGWIRTIHAQGSTLYTGSQDETVRLWDLNTTECFQVIQAKGPVQTLLPIPQALFSAAGDHIQVWDTNNPGFPCANDLNNRSPILCMWRKQNQLLCGSISNSLKIWSWDNL